MTRTTFRWPPLGRAQRHNVVADLRARVPWQNERGTAQSDNDARLSFTTTGRKSPYHRKKGTLLPLLSRLFHLGPEFRPLTIFKATSEGYRI